MTTTTATFKARKNGRVRFTECPNGITWEVTDSRFFFTGGIMFLTGTRYNVRIDRSGKPWRHVQVTGANTAAAAWELAAAEVTKGRGEAIDA